MLQQLFRQPLYRFLLKRLVFLAWVFLGLVLVGLLAFSRGRVSIAAVPSHPPSDQVAIASMSPDQLVLAGKESYQLGQFSQARAYWQQAAQLFQDHQDRLNQALVLSYLALAQQQLGDWSEAMTSIYNGLELLDIHPGEAIAPDRLPILAQVLNTQGTLQFSQGQVEQALETWHQAADTYSQLGNESKRIGALINQAQALQSLGFYLQAQRTLTEVEQTLQQQADPTMRAIGLRSLGDVLRLTGNLDASRQVLEQSRDAAQTARSHTLSATLLSLGNTARSQRDDSAALEFYQQAAAHTDAPITHIQAQLNQLSLLVEMRRWSEAQRLVSALQAQLAQLPLSRAAIYASINFADSLINLAQGDSATATATEVDLSTQAAQTLASGVQQAQALGDSQAEAYALGYLAHVYETTQQWEEAQSLTQRALLIAQAINAPDITYRWQWQLGRILKAQDQKSDALQSYQAAFNTLQSIRSDLLATNSDVQFSFRESVEPVYREYVDLLLQPSALSAVSEANLAQAREVIESLQLAELDNFFKAACLEAQAVPVDQVDQSSAVVIYPIILADRLEVIFSLPHQPLQHYTTNVSQAQVEKTLQDLRQSLEKPYTSPEGKALGQQVYDWLIQPIETDLKQRSIQTLVFVLDGALRNVPMAALFDGDRYLLEQYSIAIAPGLKLLSPRPLRQTQLEVLAAGLTEERHGFAALLNVRDELQEISDEVPTRVLLNRDFTSTALQEQIDALPYPVVHLATHGQFSSNANETFILAWDKPIKVNELNSLLRSADEVRPTAIELLVLSACETAAGDSRAALGLAGVAVQAGARSTLASLWSVDDESGARLISQFYRELANRKVTKAEALRQAQLSLLQDPNYRHPASWAPYVLVGNWL